MKVKSPIIDSNGKVYESIRELCRLKGVKKTCIIRSLGKRGYYEFEGLRYCRLSDHHEEKTQQQIEQDEQYENYLSAKKDDFAYYKFDSECLKAGDKYAISLFSDSHIEDTVRPDSVLCLH